MGSHLVIRMIRRLLCRWLGHRPVETTHYVPRFAATTTRCGRCDQLLGVASTNVQYPVPRLS
jgi:hypothetical protein